MTSTDLTIKVNGQPLPITAADYAHGDMCTLDGLTVRWGRASRLDQPRAAVATMSIALPTDPLAATATLDQLHQGAPIEIAATSVQGNAPAQTQTIRPNSTTRKDEYHQFWVFASFQPAGTNPAAWDAYPRARDGDTYTASVQVTIPPYSTAYLRPLYLHGPWNNAYSYGPNLRTVKTTSTAQTVALAATWTVPPEEVGKWVSVAVRVIPLGPKWSDDQSPFSARQDTWDALTTITNAPGTLTRRGALNRTATIFSGRITDAPVSWSETHKRPIVELAAADLAADLANRRIGAEPWPAEPAAARIRRVLTAGGYTINAVIDSAPGALQLAAKDVDSQSPAQLLETIAASTGAILWTATHATTGDYIRVEDQAQRKALYTLVIDDLGAHVEPRVKGTSKIDARHILRESVTVERDTTDLATLVAVRWIEVGVDDQGKPTTTERTEKAENADLIATHGHRALSISTELTRQADAQALAAATLARAAPGGWSIPHAVWDTKLGGELPTVMQALDATTRLGLPLIISDVDTWVPGAPSIPVYLDGGVYTYTGGHWKLAMNLTRAAVAAQSIPWKNLPTALNWSQINDLTWQDLSTVA